MTLALIGVNHKTAPIALREKIAIGRDDLAETTRALASTPGVAECMIVSTCNRVELVTAIEGPDVPERTEAPTRPHGKLVTFTIRLFHETLHDEIDNLGGPAD